MSWALIAGVVTLALFVVFVAGPLADRICRLGNDRSFVALFRYRAVLGLLTAPAALAIFALIELAG